MRISASIVAIVATHVLLAEHFVAAKKKAGKHGVRGKDNQNGSGEISEGGVELSGLATVGADLFTETMGNPQHCALGPAIVGDGDTTGADITQVSFGQPYIVGLPGLDLCPYFDVLADTNRRRLEKDKEGRRLWTSSPTNQELAQRCFLPILTTTETGTCKVKFGPNDLPLLTDTPLATQTSFEFAIGDNFIHAGAGVAEFGPCASSTKCPCIEGQMFEPGCYDSAICNTTAWDGDSTATGSIGEYTTIDGTNAVSSAMRTNAGGDKMMELLFQTNITVKVVDNERPMIGCRAGVPLKLPVQSNCKATFKPADYIPAMDNCGNAKTFCLNKFPGQTCDNKVAIGDVSSAVTSAYQTEEEFYQDLYDNGILQDEILLVQGNGCFVCFAMDSRKDDEEGNPIYSFRDAFLTNTFYKEELPYADRLTDNGSNDFIGGNTLPNSVWKYVWAVEDPNVDAGFTSGVSGFTYGWLRPGHGSPVLDILFDPSPNPQNDAEQLDQYVPISVPSQPCLVEVIVEDTTGPGIKNCPLANLPSKLPNSGDQCGYALDFSQVSGDDDCSYNGAGVTTECKIDTFGETPGSYQYSSGMGTQFLKPGKHTVTCRATDYSGNSGATCVDTIEVYDPEAPELKCPATNMVEVDYGYCYSTFSGDDALVLRAQDECGLDDWAGMSCKDVQTGEDIPVEKVQSNSWRSIDSAQAYTISPKYEFPIGLTMVECKAKDKSTNTAACYFSINVMDTKGWCNTESPTTSPTDVPTSAPITPIPTDKPTSAPVTPVPTDKPTDKPTGAPVKDWGPAPTADMRVWNRSDNKGDDDKKKKKKKDKKKSF